MQGRFHAAYEWDDNTRGEKGTPEQHGTAWRLLALRTTRGVPVRRLRVASELLTANASREPENREGRARVPHPANAREQFMCRVCPEDKNGLFEAEMERRSTRVWGR